MKKLTLAVFLALVAIGVNGQNEYDEQFRPQFHFSPKAHWMNDPNGMVFFNNTYHLFFQYYPEGTIWGPMHWGHATSKDLVHWEEKAIALFPDDLGYIFSGSVVADLNNTTGFGANGVIPLVAVFTQHDPKIEKEGKNDFENQSLAYSLDNGDTWTKYKSNPVLKNPGIRDFRDPKVTWLAEKKRWIMTLATADRISFYSSPDLKSWTKESEFGKELGAHGGVWECPDLFTLDYQGQKIWVLIVNINPGGPNGGSATQYFTGKFDGKTFTPYQTDTRWLDYGPDEYAGVTWSNTGNRKIFLGWMSNWQYATVVPTEKWRSAMTIPRELSIEKKEDWYFIRSVPVSEIDAAGLATTEFKKINASDFNLTAKTGKLNGPVKVSFTADGIESFDVELSNDKGEKLVLGYDASDNQYFIDRTLAGQSKFDTRFAARHTAPRISANRNMNMTLIIDDASVELFADDGLTVMTEIFFPSTPFVDIKIKSDADFSIKELRYTPLKRIWK